MIFKKIWIVCDSYVLFRTNDMCKYAKNRRTNKVGGVSKCLKRNVTNFNDLGQNEFNINKILG